MKRWILTGISVAGAALAVSIFHLWGNSHAQASHSPPRGALAIARWKNDADAAVSFTFDDGLQCHRDQAMPLLDAFGFKGTFFVIAGEMREHRCDPPAHEPRFHYGEAGLSWDEVKELHADGQEIGNHSMTHTFLDHITDEPALEREINGAADIIEAHVGERPLAFAYPYNQFTSLCHNVVLQRHVAAREQWTDYGGSDFTTEKADGLVLKAIANKSWLVPMIHGIDTGFQPLSSRVFHDHLAFVQQHLQQVWVDSYADVARYQQERQTAKLQLLDSESNETEFELTTPLSIATYNEPLTVVVPLPAYADSDHIEALQADRPVAFVREADRILVNVIPGPHPVSVTWK